jgi:putative flippase GtrA
MPPSTIWCTSLNVVLFPPVLHLVLDDPKLCPPLELLIKFTSWTWKAAGFRLNRKLRNWASNMSGLGQSFMKTWTFGSSPRSGSRNAWKRIKNVNVASHLSNIWNFFGAIQMNSCHKWWQWKKPAYVTMIRRQSKNQWSVVIAALHAPNNSECENPLEITRLDFVG